MERSRLFLLFSVILCTACLDGTLFAQTISFSSFTEVPTVCQEHVQRFVVQNSGGTITGNIEVTIQLPCGMTYLPGTVTSGSEADISDLNQPVFAFPELPAGSTIQVAITVLTDCAALPCLNQGSFFNTTAILAINGATSTFPSDPYNVETPRLVITNVNKTYIEAIQGQTLTRTFTIRNTRLGRLSGFTFTDEVPKQLLITSANGTDAGTTPQLLSRYISAADFQKVGNQDGYLDFNEEVVITEEVYVAFCSFDGTDALSSIRAAWGCNQSECQAAEVKALVYIEPLPEKGGIHSIQVSTSTATCYDGQAFTQSWSITNTSAYSSVLDLELNMLIQDDPNIHILLNSFMATLEGLPVQIDVQTGDTIPISCGEMGIKTATLGLPVIPPGQTLTVTFDHYFCGPEGCTLFEGRWKWWIAYEKSCARPGDQFFQAQDSIFNDSPLFIGGMTFEGGQFGALEDGQKVNFELFIPEGLFDEDGYWTVDLLVPCGLELVDTLFPIGSINPLVSTINKTGAGTNIQLRYPLPMPEKEASIPLHLQLFCDSICIPLPCEFSLITNCDDKCLGPTSKLRLEAITRFHLDEDCPPGFNPTVCASREIQVDCFDGECPDTLTVYLDHTLSMERMSFGLPDNDNNAQPDPIGDLDFTKIRLDRAMAGDTIRFIVNGIVKTDSSSETYESIWFRIKFGNRGGLPLPSDKQSAEFFQLLNGIQNVGNFLRVVDHPTGNIFEVPVEYDLNPIDSTVWCRVHFDTLAQKFNQVPMGFRLDRLDSVRLESRFLMKRIYRPYPPNYNRYEIIIGGQSNVFLFNGPFTDTISRRVCPCPNTSMGYTCLEDEFLINTGVFPICYGHIAPNHQIKIGVLTNYFPFEYRTLIDSVLSFCIEPDGFRLDSAFVTELRINGKSTAVYLPLVVSEGIPGRFCLELPASILELQEEDNAFRLIIHMTSILCERQTSGKLTKYSLNYLPFAKRFNHGETNLTSNRLFTWKRPVSRFKLLTCDQHFLQAKSTWSLQIENCFDALDNVVPMPNVWVKATSSNQSLTGVSLTNTVSGLSYPFDGERFLLGELGVCDTLYLELSAQNESCEEEDLYLAWGWSCDSTNLDNACVIHYDTCSFFAPPGVLELMPNEDTIRAALCDTMPISRSLHLDSELGAVYDLTTIVTLPFGLIYLPGSATVTYEAGSGSVYPIDDPEILSDGRLQWVLDSLVPGLDQGLPGVNSSPLNSLDLHFQTLTTCGFISGTKLIYTYKANKICDQPTNVVTKISGPYLIQGVSVPHDLDIQVNVTDTADCQQSIVLEIQIPTDQVNSSAESVTIQLPAGLTYLAGNCLTNLSITEPQLVGNRLVWPLEGGIPITSLSVVLFLDPDAPCEPLLIPVYTTATVNALCETTGQDCAIDVITGSRYIPFLIDRPAYEIASVKAVPYLGGQGVLVHLTQIGGTTPGHGGVDLWLDKDGDGQVSSGDTFLANRPFEFTSINGSVQIIFGPLDLLPQEWCHLLVVIDEATNCTCGSLVESISTPIIFPAQSRIPVCWNDSIQLGTPAPGVQIDWKGPGLSCTDCAQPWFALPNIGTDVQTFIVLATMHWPDGCDIIQEYVIDVHPLPRLLTADVTICQGDTTTLLTTPGVSWTWMGPNILPGAGQSAKMAPTETSLYSVLILDEAGCPGQDTALVQVISLPVPPSDTSFCGNGTHYLSVQQVPGTIYFWKNAGNRLDNPNSPKPKVLIQESFDFVLVMNNGFCQSIDTVGLTILDSLLITGLPDTFRACPGDTAYFTLNGGTDYTWIPASNVICLDAGCGNVKIPVLTPQTYQVNAVNMDGCSGVDQVTILPEEKESLTRDTVQICPGQVVQIFGESVGTAGEYCDTMMLFPGCLSISCIQVIVSDSLFTNLSDTLCEGESIFFFGETLTEPGTYCHSAITPAGCDSIICLTLTFLPSATIVLPPDTLLCPGDTAWVEVTLDPPGTLYDWGDGWPDLIRPVTPVNAYSLFVWNLCGKADTAIIRVDALPPPVVDLGADATFCEDSVYLIIPNLTNDAVSWFWSDGFPDLVRPVTLEGTYILSVVDSCGQMATDSIHLATRYCGPCHLDIPNLFTPNGDGVNDVFRLVKDCDVLITMKIYDRWGQVVFEQTSNDPMWDGIARGEPQPMEVYAYVISFTDPVGGSMVRRGDVTLVR